MVNRATVRVLWAFHLVVWIQAASTDESGGALQRRYIGYFEPEAQKQFEMFKREVSSFSDDFQAIEIGSFMGFVIALNASSDGPGHDGQLAKLRTMDGVAAIELDTPISLDAPGVFSEGATPHHSEQTSAAQFYVNGEQTGVDAWGIDRSDQRALPLDEIYRWREGVDGSGIKIYLIDSGVIENHEQFEGRATNHADCIQTGGCVPRAFTDSQGHGTMVAGTVISRDYGVAKGAEVRALRVHSPTSVSIAAFLNAASYIANDVEGPRIALCPILSGANEIMDAAFGAVHDAGVLVVAAAGNTGFTTCLSPSGEKIVNVGGTNDTDERAFFSTYGECADIYAPGSRILTTHSRTGTTVVNGSAFSAGHVAGAAALIMQRFMLENDGEVPTPDEIAEVLFEESTKDVVTGVDDAPGGPWPNRLLFTNPRP